jgi:hypothetical protein
LTVGKEAADERILLIPDSTSGITAFGSDLNVIFDAVWAMPETPNSVSQANSPREEKRWRSFHGFIKCTFLGHIRNRNYFEFV